MWSVACVCVWGLCVWSVYVCMCMWRVHVYVVCVCLCMEYVYVSVECIRMHVCMYLCMCVCVCSVYMCMHVYNSKTEELCLTHSLYGIKIS